MRSFPLVLLKRKKPRLLKLFLTEQRARTGPSTVCKESEPWCTFVGAVLPEDKETKATGVLFGVVVLLFTQKI